MAGRKATTSIIPGDYALSVGNPGKKHLKKWVYVPLLEIAELATGHTPSRKIPEYWNGTIPWMAVGDARKFDGKKIFETKEYTNPLGISNSAAVLLPRGTICLSRTASIGYSVQLGREMATSQGFVNFICGPFLLPGFLQNLFLAERRFLYSISEGTAHTTIYYPEVKAFNVALPPLPEQKRIVTKLDSLFGRLEEVKTRLDKIPILLKNFRHAILTQAVTGKLTEEWRDRVKSDSEELGEWSINRLDEIADTRLGKMLDKAKNTGDYFNYLRNTNVRWFGFDLNDLSQMKVEKEELAKFKLVPNDVLVCEGGEPGRAAIWKGEITDVIFQKALHRVRLIDSVLPQLLVYNLKVDADNKTLDKLFTGTTIKHLTGRSFSRYEISVPPLEEQTEIVKRVEALFAKTDAIEAKYQVLKKQIDQLPQAILAKAFRGELVEQLPTDGDAKDLLREIMELRAAAANVKKESRKQRKKTPAKSTKKTPALSMASDGRAELNSIGQAQFQKLWHHIQSAVGLDEFQFDQLKMPRGYSYDQLKEEFFGLLDSFRNIESGPRLVQKYDKEQIVYQLVMK